ncbi:MAG: hemerythrin domain-containing protein [Bryobacteraceae bacterium]
MRRDKNLIPLSHQHHNGLALCVLTDRSLLNDPSPENVARLAERAVDRFDLELTNHFRIEEDVLFPAIDLPVVAELVAEHREMERLIIGLRAMPDEKTLKAFTFLLRRHIRREEDELFEQIQQRLPPETLERLGGEIERLVVRVCL